MPGTAAALLTSDQGKKAIRGGAQSIRSATDLSQVFFYLKKNFTQVAFT